MKTKIIEATNGPLNWGKFMVSRFDHEWQVASSVDTRFKSPLLQKIGWDRSMIWVADLQTMEAAAFSPGAVARSDLNKHQIWVCPLFEPFLEWLYEQDLSDLSALPDLVDLPSAPFNLRGYRRPGSARNRRRLLRSWRRVKALIDFRSRAEP